MADDDGLGLAAALDELYGVDPSEFVATRKRLAGELRGAGDRDAAKELAGARRPTQAAGLLNQVARTSPQLVSALLDGSDAVREAQSSRSTGTQADVRAAIQAQREALAALVAEAAPSEVSDAVRTEVLAIVHAAAVDPAAADLLQTGRLVRVPDAPSGFGEMRSSAPVAASSTRSPSARRSRRAASTPDEGTDSKKKQEAVARRKAEAERARAQAELDEASATLRASSDQVAAAEARVERARAEAEEARAELARAKRAHSESNRVVHQRTKALEQVERRLSS